MRELRNAENYDKDNVCFICNLDRFVFDMKSNSFEVHTARDHNIWNYLYFMYSIKKKNQSNFNTYESYVDRKIKNDDNSWVPMNQALSLGVSAFRHG